MKFVEPSANGIEAIQDGAKNYFEALARDALTTIGRYK